MCECRAEALKLGAENAGEEGDGMRRGAGSVVSGLTTGGVVDGYAMDTGE